MPKLADIDTFGLALPDVWTALPLEQSAFDRFHDELITRWRSESAWDRTSERRADVLLQRVRQQLIQHGVSFAAAYVDVAVPDGVPSVEENLEPLMAACTFAIYTRNDFDTDLPLTLPMLHAAFSKRAEPDMRFGSITNVQPPVVQQLPVGKAVRLRRLYKPKGFGPGAVEPFFGESYLIPVDEDGHAAGVLQFATTNIDSARDFSDLFLAIAQTVTVLTPDEPTEINLPDIVSGEESPSWPI